MPSIVDLLTLARPQDDDAEGSEPRPLRVLHRVGGRASRDQILALADAQRRLGLLVTVLDEADAARPDVILGAEGSPDVVHLHGVADAEQHHRLAGVVVLDARSNRGGAPVLPGTTVLAQTKSHAAALAAAGIAPDVVRVVLPAVPPDAWRLGGREPDRGSGFVVGVVATASPARWVVPALDALVPVLAARPGAELWVGGAAALAAATDWTSGRATPVLRRMDSIGAAAVGRLDVMVCLDPTAVPSPAVLSGMQLRRPIIASRIGASRELLDNGVSALLVAPGDVTALVASVRRLVRHPVERATLGGAAAEVAASQHAPAREAVRLTRIYEQLLVAEDDAVAVTRSQGFDQAVRASG